MQQYSYFEKADAAPCIGTGEMFVIVKVDITQEPGVSKFLTGAIKLLIATQMSPCAQKIKLLATWYSLNHKKKK